MVIMLITTKSLVRDHYFLSSLNQKIIQNIFLGQKDQYLYLYLLFFLLVFYFIKPLLLVRSSFLILLVTFKLHFHQTSSSLHYLNFHFSFEEPKLRLQYLNEAELVIVVQLFIYKFSFKDHLELTSFLYIHLQKLQLQ